MAFEERAEKCWDCKYFIQINDSGNSGVCARKAPSKLSQEANEGAGVYPALSFFQSLSDGTITFCGGFTLLPGTIPPIPTP